MKEKKQSSLVRLNNLSLFETPSHVTDCGDGWREVTEVRTTGPEA